MAFARALAEDRQEEAAWSATMLSGSPTVRLHETMIGSSATEPVNLENDV